MMDGRALGVGDPALVFWDHILQLYCKPWPPIAKENIKINKEKHDYLILKYHHSQYITGLLEFWCSSSIMVLLFLCGFFLGTGAVFCFSNSWTSWFLTEQELKHFTELTELTNKFKGDEGMMQEYVCKRCGTLANTKRDAFLADGRRKRAIPNWRETMANNWYNTRLKSVALLFHAQEAKAKLNRLLEHAARACRQADVARNGRSAWHVLRASHPKVTRYNHSYTFLFKKNKLFLS